MHTLRAMLSLRVRQCRVGLLEVESLRSSGEQNCASKVAIVWGSQDQRTCRVEALNADPSTPHLVSTNELEVRTIQGLNNLIMH